MNLIPRSFFFNDDFDDFFITSSKRNDMKCDIYEKDNMYHIEMDIPGFDKEDINIELKNNYLTIKASKTKEEKEEDKNYIRRERSYGEYSRTFSLGEVDEDKVNAKFDNGTLLITVPKKDQEELKKTIEIK
ncbi:MAG: Hsp20/alpha crystallin family protein [Bacilli bacterium]|nr:Hsp20/alpha crystallin family protein [Bacilli bacterium]MDD4407811.1 Hsp20/alpha crystallin family protein [Bacilli bacterium]